MSAMTPNASYSITLRLRMRADDPSAIGRTTTAIGEATGAVTALDFVETQRDMVVIDVTVNAGDAEHAEQITAAVDSLDGVEVHRVSDRTFLLHLRGKLEVRSTVPLKTRDDLSMAYTPGVARVCRAIAQTPDDARRLTIKGNTVAIVTDGSAVLGLGDIGPAAALPVMEGKAALFKRFAGIDAWPVCLDTKDPDEIVRTVEAIAPVYGGINLEDISAPRCFEIEDRLRASLDIPVFHDDQHGTAIVVLAALINALRLVGKELCDVTVALSGAGAAGMAIARLLLREGIGELLVADADGIIGGVDHPCAHESHVWLRERTNRDRRGGRIREALEGADVFIGVSAPDLLEPEDLKPMRRDPIVFALANPDPEIDPVGARQHAAVVATGRSDQPNQINNVLAFPGIFRGALDARARYITEDMKVAAARALADVVGAEELHPSHIIPSVFSDRVVPVVADAVRRQAEAEAETDQRLTADG
ncbi:NAD-dependent malic enzyme [Egicoccus sp. AB-alg2]|uniref:NAD-dependent malic enzyme n=1 Tax=Egicoccus sp. AB-alg2 TaxID=3242693 RepID=UPI00359D520C